MALNQNALGLYPLSSRSRGDHIGRNETDQWKASFQMPSNRQTTNAKAAPKNRKMSSEQLRLSTRIAQQGRGRYRLTVL
jgi:hypothetical protein